jgi:hypothetical protein
MPIVVLSKMTYTQDEADFNIPTTDTLDFSEDNFYSLYNYTPKTIGTHYWGAIIYINNGGKLEKHFVKSIIEVVDKK